MSDYNLPTRKVFPNRVVLWNIANDLLNTLLIGFTRGSRDDPFFLDGGWHLGEHLMIRRGKEVTLRMMDRYQNRYLGGSDGPGMNVQTKDSHTCFGFTDRMLRSHLEEGVHVFGTTIRDNMYEMRRMRANDSALIRPEEFDVEVNAVGCETGEWEEQAFFRAY